ncbi:MAG: fumarylacetoacetate hydrolase family protein [Gemmatimonadetes bacterium]|nr:fumarylacetoacetate hydrolase family protein [Gemmatimonadota bacterium]
MSSAFPLAGVHTILCVGRNYRAAGPPGFGPAAKGAAAPLDAIDQLELFMKPATAIVGDGQPIRLPGLDGVDPQVDVEGELAIVIGATASRVEPHEALRHVLGYAIANDVTAKRWQTPGPIPLWMRGKGFDTFCPLGPRLVPRREIADPNNLLITTSVNGRVFRRASTAEMIRPVAALISQISRAITLRPGTVILTGAAPLLPEAAPHVRPLRAGDEVAVEIESMGRLVNPVR